MSFEAVPQPNFQGAPATLVLISIYTVLSMKRMPEDEIEACVERKAGSGRAF